MSIELFIKEEAMNLGDRVYIAPNIQDKKMDGAISGMAPGIDPNYVLAIVDTTLFGSGKEGCMFTGEYLYIHAMLSEKIKVQLSQINNIDYNRFDRVKKNGKIEVVEKLILSMENDMEIDLTNDLNSINKRSLSRMLQRLVEMGSEEEGFVSTSQVTPLSMMDIEIKKDYIKLICNFAYSDDNKIDSKEYAEIISLIVRIEMDSKSRIEIREYIINNKIIESNENLLGKLEDRLTLEEYEIIKKSLIKDILNIYYIKDEKLNWHENEFIIKLIKILDTNEVQVELIKDSIISDQDILKERKNDSEITKSIKDIAAAAAGVGVPLSAIYLSGSVIGVSAAGMTSGLATLGMGGLLGFSGMLSGIGVAVLLGVGTYKGLKKITGISDLENNKQREAMLQNIVRNSQKALNYLIEDVNEIAKQLSEEIRKGLNSSSKIEELTKILEMLINGSQEVSDKMNDSEKEKVITKLPIRLDVTRLEELTNTPTKLKFREAVIGCYIDMTIENEDDTISNVYELNDKLSIEYLINLGSILEGIGYNKLAEASIASLKGVTKKFIGDIVR